MTHAPGSNAIELDVPADDRYLQVLRVTAAAVAAGLFDEMDRLDDVRLAIDELAVAVIRAAEPGERLHIVLRPAPDHLVVSGRVPADGEAPHLSSVGQTLLATICDGYRLAREDGDLVFELVVNTV